MAGGVVRTDAAAAAAAAHTLKGSAGNLGAFRLAEACSRLEHAAKEADWTGGGGALGDVLVEARAAQGALQAEAEAGARG